MSYSTFLFARPTFWEGVARIFDFGNVLQEYNTSPSPELTDYLAVIADWQAVGDDMRMAINNNTKQSLLSRQDDKANQETSPIFTKK